MRESVKKRMVELLLTFCMVTTGSVFVCAVYNKIFWSGDTFLDGDILWQLLALAFVCSLGNFIHPYREISRRRAAIDKGLHYVYINVVVLGSGYLFGWMDIENLSMLAVMAVGILVVFVTVSFVIWRLHARETENLNRKLREYQQTGENRHGLSGSWADDSHDWGTEQ
ncbi:MAG: DUF3021 family protein [Lachnospiraceae bacterium]|nr:DUF3021 family protein [Lachnospiraceae bacterium]